MRVADDFPEGTWRGCDCDIEEALGAVGNPSGAAAVEPEGELLEVAGEVLEAHGSLVGAEDPSLDQRENQMNSRVAGLAEPGIAAPAIGVGS